METNNALVTTSQTGIDFANPKSLETLQRACKMFTTSDLVPATYSAAKVGEAKAVANCIIALDMSSRTGANPLMIMQNLYVVQGRPSFSSSFLVASINSSGRYETLRYKKGVIEGGVKDKQGKLITGLQNMFCYAYTWERNKKYFSEADKEESKLVSTKITMQMAVDEGWYDKPGSKWKTMPSQMLMYRAAAFWCRAFAPEISMGMHTAEEVEDGFDDSENIQFEDVTENAEKTNEETPKQKSMNTIMQEQAEKFLNNNKPTEETPQEETINLSN